MAGKHSKSGKKRTHKNRRQNGGGWGFTGASSIPGTPGIVSNPYVATAIGDCRAVQPGYNIPTSSYGAFLKGLPGMSGLPGMFGGKHKHKRTRKMKGRKRTQRGGRYGFAPEMDPNASGQAWWAGSYAPIQRIACEGGSFNRLNPTHTPSSAPAGGAPPNYYFNPKSGLMSGGAQQMAPATYGVGNVDSMYYYAPTAGYANTASTWNDSVGGKVQLQVPYGARSMNPACLSTGGHPPLTGALQKGGVQDTSGELLPFGLGGLVGAVSGLFGPSSNGQNGQNGPNRPGSGAAAGPGNLPSISIPPLATNNPSTPPTNNSSIPPTPLELSPAPNSQNQQYPQGGRRHKKSRKNRKGKKHSRKH